MNSRRTLPGGNGKDSARLPMAAARNGRLPPPSATRGGSGVEAGVQRAAAAGRAGTGPLHPPISDQPLSDMFADGRSPVQSGEAPATPPGASVGRVALSAGDPYPPISGREIDGFGTALAEQRRLSPRSPRAALEPEHVTVPTRRSKKARNPLVIIGNAIFTLIVLAVIGGGAAFILGKQRFEAPGPLTEDKVVVIPPRQGVLDIADLLQREGVIAEHRIIFVGGVFAMKARSELKSGEYQFAKGSSVRDVVETIVHGRVVQHSLTIPEGLTSEQIVARLLESKILSGNINEIPREGSLLPETYKFTRGTLREQVLQRMRQAQARVLQEAWERRSPDLPIGTPQQLVILASIIEKETGRLDERTRVASVFANRLKRKMRLQSDPTIIYGIAGGKGSLGRPITRTDIDRPTPYNTYVIDGLPPGPIANPGRASIEAAASPARTRELYFVADGSGGHVFSETYEQHQRAVAKLRGIERDARDSKPPALAAEPSPPETAEAKETEPPPPPPRRRRNSRARTQ